MTARLNEIEIVFKSKIDNLKVIKDFEVIDDYIIGEIEVICGSKPNVSFDVKIDPSYPLKVGSVESISFVNINLKQYSHINPNGSICFHTQTSPDLTYKLGGDIKALLEWVDKYYIQEIVDDHFEYPFYTIQDEKNVFLFCDTDTMPSKDDFGNFYFTRSNTNGIKSTYLIQGLKSHLSGVKTTFLWNSYYGSFKNSLKGLFFISDRAPVLYRNFSFNNWLEFEGIFSADFLKFLNDSKRNIEKKDLLDGKFFVLLYGFPILGGKFSYETVMVDYYNIPAYKGELLENKITWYKTVDSSYELFFGRGKLHDSLTESKILVLGIGALGSNLAESLVRGGCKKVDLFDNDIKEIGNICRAKYNFLNGENQKVDELLLSLISISPFVEITKYNNAVVPLISDELKRIYLEVFDRYDYIFNCTASNDVNIIIDRLPIKSQLITISISNHAKDLVCVIGKENVFQENAKIYNEINQDLSDMFNPQGCWNPTFKASFHNINALLNYTLSNIDYRLRKDLPLKTFMLEVQEEENYTIKLKD